MTGVVHIDHHSPAVVVLTIDNPPMNPLGPDMRAAFMAVLDEVEKNDALRCIVITGKGRSFCAGDDLKQAHASGGEDLAGFSRLLERLDQSRVPIVAAINGWCVGGGFELALCCDIRIASTEARFTAAGVNMGLMASAYRLPRLIGVSRAKQILLTGLPTDATTAEHYGLVTALHAPDALMPAALELAERLASRAPLSVEATKRVSSRAPDLSPEDAETMQAKELRVLRRSEDHKEAVAAFNGKRDPVFNRR